MVPIKNTTRRIKQMFCNHKKEEPVFIANGIWVYPTGYSKCKCCRRIRRNV